MDVKAETCRAMWDLDGDMLASIQERMIVALVSATSWSIVHFCSDNMLVRTVDPDVNRIVIYTFHQPTGVMQQPMATSIERGTSVDIFADAPDVVSNLTGNINVLESGMGNFGEGNIVLDIQVLTMFLPSAAASAHCVTHVMVEVHSAVGQSIFLVSPPRCIAIAIEATVAQVREQVRHILNVAIREGNKISPSKVPGAGTFRHSTNNLHKSSNTFQKPPFELMLRKYEGVSSLIPLTTISDDKVFLNECRPGDVIVAQWDEGPCNTAIFETTFHPTFSQVTIRPPPDISIYDCLDRYFEHEQMREEENCVCSRCKQPGAHIKQLSLSNAPEVLIIHLNRFKFDLAAMSGDHHPNTTTSRFCREKITTFIDYPMDGLNLTKYVGKISNLVSSPCLYDLIAVSMHSGSLDTGHYIACARNPLTENWYGR